MTTKTIEMLQEQVDEIVISELKFAIDMCQFDKDQTLLVSLINVLKYYMAPDAFESYANEFNLL